MLEIIFKNGESILSINFDLWLRSLKLEKVEAVKKTQMVNGEVTEDADVDTAGKSMVNGYHHARDEVIEEAACSQPDDISENTKTKMDTTVDQISADRNDEMNLADKAVKDLIQSDVGASSVEIQVKMIVKMSSPTKI